MPLLGIPETDDGFDADWGRRQFFAGFWPPAPIVAGGKPLRALMRAQLVQFIRPNRAAVCQTRIEQIGNPLGIAGKPLTLEKRAFVKIQGKPCHTVKNGLHRRIGLTFSIGVFNAQDKSAALMTRKGPRIERRADIAEMDQSRRTWRKTGANLGSHQGLG